MVNVIKSFMGFVCFALAILMVVVGLSGCAAEKLEGYCDYTIWTNSFTCEF